MYFDGYHEIRVVGIANAPTRNRTTRQLGFTVDRNGKKVQLTSTASEVQLDGELKMTVVSNLSGKIEILQNERFVAKATSGNAITTVASIWAAGKRVCKLFASQRMVPK
jgi:hypothetical protein